MNNRSKGFIQSLELIDKCQWFIDKREIKKDIENMINTGAIYIESCSIETNDSGYPILALKSRLLYLKYKKQYKFILNLNPALYPEAPPECIFIEYENFKLNESCEYIEFLEPRGLMTLPFFSTWNSVTKNRLVSLAEALYNGYKKRNPVLPSLKDFIREKYSNVNECDIPIIPRSDIQIQQEIGKGSFSSVYTGLLLNSPFSEKDCEIALKVTANIDDKLRNIIRYEINIQNRFKHRNIVPILGVCMEQDSIIIVMKRGDFSLEKEISGCGTISFSPFHLKEVTLALCKAICYMHTNNPPFIHRDIKIENILVFDKVYKLGDFGLACASDQPNKIFGGTRGYTAPEILMGDGSYNEIADIYSIGSAILYIFTGKTPLEWIPRDIVQTNKIDEFIAKGNRPMIPSSVPQEVRKVIELCYRTKYTRPSIEVILGYVLNWKPETWKAI
ncbi:hypothetical protein WA158_003963 [Blastocystis sp. Blastoise]